MNTCASCKHWDRASNPLPMGPDEFHLCRATERPMICTTPYDHNGGMATRAEFGCTQWEEETGRALLTYMTQHRDLAREHTAYGDDVRQFRPALSRTELERIVTLLEKDVG